MPLVAAREPAVLASISRLYRGSTVASMLPGHEQYARVFSPAHERSGTPVRWSGLAGADMRADLQWDELEGLEPRASELDAPTEGSIDPATAAALVAFLRTRTSTPDRCVFLVWEGYAGLDEVAAAAPRVPLDGGHRIMHVLQGGIEDALHTVEHTPSGRLPLWWLPADGAWSLGADLYGRSACIGGTHRMIQALASSADLEALPVPTDHPVGSEEL